MRLLHCNQDFTFPGAHAQPRLGPGAFLELLQHLFVQTTGQQLQCELHGASEARLQQMSTQSEFDFRALRRQAPDAHISHG